jgi:hypothetical protein
MLFMPVNAYSDFWLLAYSVFKRLFDVRARSVEAEISIWKSPRSLLKRSTIIHNINSVTKNFPRNVLIIESL